MYHYIFFDLDGTLTDSKEGILNSLRYAFDKLGEPVPPESTLIKFIGPPLQDSFAEFCGFSAERPRRPSPSSGSGTSLSASLRTWPPPAWRTCAPG